MSNLMQINDLNIDIKKKSILKNVNLTLDKGKIYGLLGPNGAGKTTLLKTMLGVFKPTVGHVYLNNENIYAKKNPNLMSKVGSIIEFPGFYNNLTLMENLELHLNYLNSQPTKQRLEELLEFVGLSKDRNKLFSNSSLGMKQRMGIARAVSNDPILLLLDEPTNGLDPQGIKHVRNMLTEEVKKRNTTIIVSSHLLAEVDLIADELIFINNGEVILTAANTRETNYMYDFSIDASENDRVTEVLQEIPHLLVEQRGNQIKIITSMEEEIFKEIVYDALSVDFFQSKEFSLEDLYLHLLERGE